MRDRTGREPHEGAWRATLNGGARSAPTTTAGRPGCPRNVPVKRFKRQSRAVIPRPPDELACRGDGKWRKVRCPTCGRRLTLETTDYEDGYGDWGARLPPHKIRKTKWKGG